MGDGEMESTCTINSSVVEGNTMKWSMDCSEGEGSSRAVWEATSHGNTLTGTGKVTANYGGQTMTMDMTWAGKRIGDCG